MQTAETDDYKFNFCLRYNGVQQKVQVILPVLLSKFVEPTEMDSQTFFLRWKQVFNPEE